MNAVTTEPSGRSQNVVKFMKQSMLTMLLPGELRQENDCKLKANLVFTRVSVYPRLPSKILKPQKEKKM